MSWRTNGTRVEDSDGRLVAYLTPWSTEADARLMAACEDMQRALAAVVAGFPTAARMAKEAYEKSGGK